MLFSKLRVIVGILVKGASVCFELGVKSDVLGTPFRNSVPCAPDWRDVHDRFLTIRRDSFAKVATRKRLLRIAVYQNAFL